MRRTKEAYYREHQNWMDMETISGCREFGGEDLRTRIFIQSTIQEKSSLRINKRSGWTNKFKKRRRRIIAKRWRSCNTLSKHFSLIG